MNKGTPASILESANNALSFSRVTNIRKDLDPCKQFTDTPDYPKHLVQSMGLLPTHIDVENSLMLRNQVFNACGIEDYAPHKLEKFETDKDGTYECVPNVSCAYATAVISRCVDGAYEAIYFYVDGSVIIQMQEFEEQHYYYLRLSN